MSPELAAILGVGAFLFSLQAASTLWLASVIGSACDELRADIRREFGSVRAHLPACRTETCRCNH